MVGIKKTKVNSSTKVKPKNKQQKNNEIPLEEIIKHHIENEVNSLAVMVKKSWQSKDFEIKTLNLKVNKLENLKETEENRMQGKIKNIEKHVKELIKENTGLKVENTAFKVQHTKPCDQCKQMAAKIEALSTHIQTIETVKEVEEERLKGHIYKRKIKLAEYKKILVDRDDVIEKQEAKIATLLKEYNYLNDMMDESASEGKVGVSSKKRKLSKNVQSSNSTKYTGNTTFQNVERNLTQNLQYVFTKDTLPKTNKDAQTTVKDAQNSINLSQNLQYVFTKDTLPKTDSQGNKDAQTTVKDAQNSNDLQLRKEMLSSTKATTAEDPPEANAKLDNESMRSSQHKTTTNLADLMDTAIESFKNSDESFLERIRNKANKSMTNASVDTNPKTDNATASSNVSDNVHDQNNSKVLNETPKNKTKKFDSIFSSTAMKSSNKRKKNKKLYSSFFDEEITEEGDIRPMNKKAKKSEEGPLLEEPVEKKTDDVDYEDVHEKGGVPGQGVGKYKIYIGS